eukprot:UN06431
MYEWESMGSYLVSGYPQIEDRFGHSVSLNGDGTLLAVGVPGDGTDGAGVNAPLPDLGSGSRIRSGAVYVYVYSSDDSGQIEWRQEVYIKADNPGST